MSKIPKNRNIEEIVNTEDDITMEEIIRQMDEKEKRKKEENKRDRKSFQKKLQQACTRKDAQLAENKRKEEYQKAVAKIIEQQEEEK